MSQALQTTNSFGALLRHYRERAGLSQEALAERAGLTGQAVSVLERGERRRPYPATIRRLAEALDLPDEDRAALLAAVPSREHAEVPSADTRQAGRGAPPDAAVSEAPGSASLPSPLTPLLGREEDLARASEFLRQGVRLLTLTGPGGVGKTRLALQVAADTDALFTEGVTFVPLAALADARLVLSTVAQALGVREGGGESLGDLLRRALRGRRLLVLDNCEHLLPGMAEIAALLEDCPDLTVVATSRASLRVRGEQEYLVLPLALPSSDRALTREEAERSPAVRLFVERAQAMRTDFALTEENAATVVEICRRLDGLPLAIELAAVRVRLFPPQALLARLSDRLRVLTGGVRDLPARQQTLRGAMEWSYDLLTAGEQRLFQHLGVFVGGCSLEAAEVVCSGEGDLELDVLDGVYSLLAQSLIRQVEETSGEPRLVMLETMREYALERLRAGGEAHVLQRRHARYFLELAEEMEPGLHGGSLVASLERLETEHANLRAALQWALDTREVDLGLRLALALARFVELRGHLSEGRAWLRDLLAVQNGGPPDLVAEAVGVAARLAEAQGDLRGAVSLAERSLDLHRELGNNEILADMLAWLGRVMSRQGDPDRAISLCQDAVTVARSLGKPDQIARLLLDLAWVEQWQGFLERASERCEESLALYRAVGDRTGMARALELLTWVTESQGDIRRAQALSAENLALLREIGAQEDVRGRLDELAMRARSQAEFGQANALLQESEAMSLGLGDHRRAAHTRLSRALVARQLGEYEHAAELYRESLEVFRTMDDLGGVAHALLGLGDIARDVGDASRVADYCEESLALFRELGDVRFIGYCLHNLGLAIAWQGDFQGAESLLDESLPLQQTYGGKDDVTEVYASLGLVALERADYERAGRMFANGLQVGPMVGTPWLGAAALALEGMASVVAALGRSERAARLFGAAEAIQTVIGAPIWPSFRRAYERYREGAQAALGDERFKAAWQEGHNMTIDEALAQALGEPVLSSR